MKKCSNPKCIHKGKLQPLSNFSVCNANNDGLQYNCKDCNKISIKKWREKNPKQVKKTMKEYRQTKKGRRIVNKCSKVYRKNNPNYYKGYYKKNREKINKQKRERYHKNKLNLGNHK